MSNVAMEQKIRDRKRADTNRQWVAQLKLAKGCVDCGYNKNAYALEFDHLPGTKGNKTVASMMYNSREAILREIAKCEIVCANCHAIRTMVRKCETRIVA